MSTLMESKPLVSVLCLCYNQAKFIVESLESVKAQTYPHYEILICDDFSIKDNSVEVIEKWIAENPELQIVFLKHEENKGICKSLNELLYLSNGKYLQLLALDDVLLPEKLERHVSILENSRANEAMVFSDAHLMADDSTFYQNTFIPYHFKYLSLKSQNYHELLLNKNFIPAMSVMMKKLIIVEMGGWDENLSFEDYDMWLRISKKYDFIYDKVISCNYRLHATNTHKNEELIDSSFFDIFVKHIDNKDIRKRIFYYIEKMYLNNSMKSEYLVYFDFYPPTNFFEKCILNNRNTVIFKLALRVESAKSKQNRKDKLES